MTNKMGWRAQEECTEIWNKRVKDVESKVKERVKHHTLRCMSMAMMQTRNSVKRNVKHETSYGSGWGTWETVTWINRKDIFFPMT